jgi:hypothetical protein
MWDTSKVNVMVAELLTILVTLLFVCCYDAEARAEIAVGAEAADAGSNGSAIVPEQQYDAQKLSFNGIVATAKITVNQQSQIRVTITGSQSRVASVVANVEGDTLVITSRETGTSTGPLIIQVAVPGGTPVSVSGFVGELDIGDSQGTVEVSASALTAHIGRVSSASMDVNGTYSLDIAGVKSQLSLTLAGAGSAKIGQVGDFRCQLSGSGSVAVDSVNGAVDLNLTGSSRGQILAGKADPFKIKLLGSGSFEFDGTANNPSVEGFGSGVVRLGTVTGNLNSGGTIRVIIGNH